MFRTTQRPSVFLVEDEPDDAFFFMRTVRLSGQAGQVTHVADGRLAIQHLERAAAGGEPRPNLVFLDLKIPNCSGFEVLEWIRAQHYNPLLEIAVLSGSEQRADMERALELGATGYYVKPILVGQLNARISSWQEKQTGDQPDETQVASSLPNQP